MALLFVNNKKVVHAMTEKELKKMNRYQLLELLIAQTERGDRLETALEEANGLIAAQEIKLESLGSIAEASLELSGVFRAAQNAADIYVNAAKKRAEAIEEEARIQANEIIAQAKAEARRIKDEE